MNATAIPITRIATPTVSNPRVTFSMTSLNVTCCSHDRPTAARLHPAGGTIVVPWPTTSATREPRTGSCANERATRATGPSRPGVRPRSGSVRRASGAIGSTSCSIRMTAIDDARWAPVRRARVPPVRLGPCRSRWSWSRRSGSWRTASITRWSRWVNSSGLSATIVDAVVEGGRGIVQESVRPPRCSASSCSSSHPRAGSVRSTSSASSPGSSNPAHPGGWSPAASRSP